MYRYNQEKDGKEHVEQDSQVSMFLITYAKKGNHSVTGASDGIFHRLMCQVDTHKVKKESKDKGRGHKVNEVEGSPQKLTNHIKQDVGVMKSSREWRRLEDKKNGENPE